MAKMWTVPLSLEQQRKAESRLKLMLRNKQTKTRFIHTLTESLKEKQTATYSKNTLSSAVEELSRTTSDLKMPIPLEFCFWSE